MSIYLYVYSYYIYLKYRIILCVVLSYIPQCSLCSCCQEPYSIHLSNTFIIYIHSCLYIPVLVFCLYNQACLYIPKSIFCLYNRSVPPSPMPPRITKICCHKLYHATVVRCLVLAIQCSGLSSLVVSICYVQQLISIVDIMTLYVCLILSLVYTAGLYLRYGLSHSVYFGYIMRIQWMTNSRIMSCCYVYIYY